MNSPRLASVRNPRQLRTLSDGVARFYLPAIAVKALDAAVQGLAGLMLVIIPGSVLNGFSSTIATRDMVNDPQHLFARHIASLTELAQQDDHHMTLIYGLFAVAIVKLTLAIAMLARVRGSLVAGILVYGSLTMFEAMHGSSPALIVVTVLDAAVVVVIAAQLIAGTAPNQTSAR